MGNTSFQDKQIRANLLRKQKKEYIVTIGVTPSCYCEYFARSSTSRKKVLGKHIVWVMLSILGVPEESNLLHQVGSTESEVEEIFKGVPDRRANEKTMK